MPRERRVDQAAARPDRMSSQGSLAWRNAIFFPWDPAAKKFKGEMVYTDLALQG